MLTYTRGSGAGGGCTDANAAELAWERIELPANSVVQSFDLSMPNGTAFLTQAITAVPDDRLLLLLSGQGPGGQTSGETNANTDNLGFVHAVPTVSGTTLTVTRPTTGKLGDFTPYVIQLPP